MKKKLVLLVIAFSCIFSMSYAHSGRTDSSGGHKDNKNKSGLGYYNYHHGYKAHLHKNGVCPYDSKLSSYKTVKAVQGELNKLGYDCGEADGIFGLNTKNSLEKFQMDKGLNVDGIINSNTLEALGI